MFMWSHLKPSAWREGREGEEKASHASWPCACCLQKCLPCLLACSAGKRTKLLLQGGSREMGLGCGGGGSGAPPSTCPVSGKGVCAARQVYHVCYNKYTQIKNWAAILKPPKMSPTQGRRRRCKHAMPCQAAKRKRDRCLPCHACQVVSVSPVPRESRQARQHRKERHGRDRYLPPPSLLPVSPPPFQPCQKLKENCLLPCCCSAKACLRVEKLRLEEKVSASPRQTDGGGERKCHTNATLPLPPPPHHARHA